jgi:hypothetical protein
LLGHDPKNLRIYLGTRWEADHYSWARIAITLKYVEEPAEPLTFRAEDLRINGKRIVDWFTNYLLKNS